MPPDIRVNHRLGLPLRLGFRATALFVASFAMFLLWGGSPDRQLLCAGLVCALLSSAVLTLTAMKEDEVLVLRLAGARLMIAAIAKSPCGATRAAAFFFAVLRGKRRQGSLDRSPVSVDAEWPRSDPGLRAAIVLAACVAPDSFAVDLREGTRPLVLHVTRTARR